MADLNSSQAIRAACTAAFPSACRIAANEAAQILDPLIDASYQRKAEDFWLQGECLRIPSRLHFRPSWQVKTALHHLPIAARCLITRSTDGFLRQAALRTILHADEPWIRPFVASLVSDYVLEIVEDVKTALPALNNAEYTQILRSNPIAARLIRARATSYWACYHSDIYPELLTYPGTVILDQWAKTLPA